MAPLVVASFLGDDLEAVLVVFLVLSDLFLEGLEFQVRLDLRLVLVLHELDLDFLQMDQALHLGHLGGILGQPCLELLDRLEPGRELGGHLELALIN